LWVVQNFRICSLAGRKSCCYKYHYSLHIAISGTDDRVDFKHGGDYRHGATHMTLCTSVGKVDWNLKYDGFSAYTTKNQPKLS